MVDFMDRVLMAQVQNANAQIAKHKINVEVLTKNASGTAEQVRGYSASATKLL